MPLTESDLSQFTGTEGYTRWSPLFRDMVLTDGSRYLADKAGAYWLMDAIASHQPTIRNLKDAEKRARLADIQFWTLSVDLAKGSAVLTCVADKGEEPVVRQEIEFSDFPLAEVKLYVQPLDEQHRVILLPSEY